MVDEDNQELAPEEPGEDVSVSKSKGRRAFRNLRRELTDDELASAAVQRMLIDDIERLEVDNGELGEYQDKRKTRVREQLLLISENIAL